MPPDRAQPTLPPYAAPAWDLGRLVLRPAGRPLVMGILNLTPDSFHPGSRVPSPEQALAAAEAMIADGADILDLGAESSRPGAKPVSEAEEQDRLLPVLETLRAQSGIPVSIDTVHAETARLALAAGADAVNDISAGRTDTDMLKVISTSGCGLVLMHMQGVPRTMQDDPRYSDVRAEVGAFLAERSKAAEAVGVAPDRIAVDPGIGFGKTLAHNLDLLAALRKVAGGRPLVLGASRKRFIGEITGAEVERRLPGSLAAAAAAFNAGAAVVRVHDVTATVQFLDVLRAVADRG